MNEPTTQTPHDLINAMKVDVESWISGNEGDLEPTYRAAIAAVGAVPLLVELFRRFGDATLTRWLMRLSFVWADLPFTAWKQVLYGVADDAPAVYQFVIFAGEFLGIDMVRLIHDDPAVHETARTFAAVRFAGGSPRAGSAWVRDVLHDHGIDSRRLWRRLAKEGAPMTIDSAKNGG